MSLSLFSGQTARTPSRCSATRSDGRGQQAAIFGQPSEQLDPCRSKLRRYSGIEFIAPVDRYVVDDHSCETRSIRDRGSGYVVVVPTHQHHEGVSLFGKLKIGHWIARRALD